MILKLTFFSVVGLLLFDLSAIAQERQAETAPGANQNVLQTIERVERQLAAAPANASVESLLDEATINEIAQIANRISIGTLNEQNPNQSLILTSEPSDATRMSIQDISGWNGGELLDLVQGVKSKCGSSSACVAGPKLPEKPKLPPNCPPNCGDGIRCPPGCSN